MAGIQIDGVNNKIDFDDDADTSISSATDDTLVFEIAGATDFTMTANTFTAASGSTIAAQALTATTGTFTSNVTISTADNTDTLTLESTDADGASGPILALYRNSGSPADDDQCGRIKFIGRNDNSEDFDISYFTASSVDVSDGSEDGSIEWYVKTGGSDQLKLSMKPTETVFNEASADVDFRVESNNKTHLFFIDAGDDRTHFGSTGHQGQNLGVHNFYSGTTADQALFSLGSNASNYASDLIKLGCLRSQSNQYTFMECLGGNGSNTINSDLEFRVKGDGNVQCDESFTGGGVDYAEFFEWKDGNLSSEDRRGYSVVLDGNKIVKATDSDDTSKIIGIVSTNPTVLGGGDMERWVYKYERDDYDSVIWEEYTVTEWKDEDGKDHSYDTDRIPSDVTAPSDATVISEEKDRYGNTIKLKRRKLNPEWDSSKQYVSREDRKEWEAIGLMGKLRLKKGEPVNPNWIKLRDISDSVEEWLVR